MTDPRVTTRGQHNLEETCIVCGDASTQRGWVLMPRGDTRFPEQNDLVEVVRLGFCNRPGCQAFRKITQHILDVEPDDSTRKTYWEGRRLASGEENPKGYLPESYWPGTYKAQM